MIDLNPPKNVGEPIPKAEVHGVSVTLPTWAANIAYELGEEWVSSKIKSGYPRFCVHWQIVELQNRLLEKYGQDDELCMILNCYDAAVRCRGFISVRAPEIKRKLRITRLNTRADPAGVVARIAILFYPKEIQPIAKQYWQHTGEGISSRLAEYFLSRSQGIFDFEQKYVEERFGRCLDLSLAQEAKLSLRKRISNQISQNSIVVQPEHVYLYPTGMTSIYSAHLLIQKIKNSHGENLKTVCFGFPYTDTLKILEKWGPGAKFYPFGSDKELDEFEEWLEAGNKVAGLFLEFPSNPLLNSPNIVRIRKLATKFDFFVACDETIGNILNVDVMPYVDLTMCSLTKIFSGDCNVMAGEIVLNPRGKHFGILKETLDNQFVDAFWAEDAIYLERNSRDFIDRNRRTDENSRAVVELLNNSDIVERVYYPSLSPTKANYDMVKIPSGGYGGLLSVVFKDKNMAPVFFDSLNIAKGPSLGTNFTLACPYTIIAHFHELDFVESCGVSRDLVRISIGLEETQELLSRFKQALEEAAKVGL